MLYIKRLLVLLATSTLIATGCGGGGGGGTAGLTYTGSTTPAAVTETNAEELSIKSTEATEEALSQNSAKESTPFTPSGITVISNGDTLNPFFSNLAYSVGTSVQQLNLPVAAITYTHIDLMNQDPSLNLCGGSVRISDALVNSLVNTGLLNGGMTFINLCAIDPDLGNVVMNGTVTFSETGTSISVQFSNISFEHNGVTDTINMTVTCGTVTPGCTFTALYEGADSKVYQVANLVVTGSGTGPYTVSATFYHPDHGSMNIAGTAIYYTCPDGSPSDGAINVTGTGGSFATLTITGCGTYSGNWDDGAGNTGMFTGTF